MAQRNKRNQIYGTKKCDLKRFPLETRKAIESLSLARLVVKAEESLACNASTMDDRLPSVYSICHTSDIFCFVQSQKYGLN